MANEELRLVEAAQRGDLEAFNTLVRQFESRVYSLCVRMLGDADTAADIAQESFVSAWRKVHTFRGGSFRSWLMRIATNACYDALRARRRRPITSLEASVEHEEEAVRELPSADETPDERLLRRELSAAIERGIAELPHDQRLVLILSDIQGLTYEEIATITSANLGTVKSRLSRGRARLRDFLRAGELLPARYRHETEN